MIPVRIHGFPTERAADGLALSSRNAYLSAGDRAKAPAIFQALSKAATAIRAGISPTDACKAAAAQLSADDFDVSYFVARDAKTLAEPAPGQTADLRLLVAARLGTTRLIDNIAV
jgi:pantoate--beta-alanine ligase